LDEVDKPGSDIDEYIVSLEKVLREKLKSIHNLQNKIQEFKNNLEEERTVNQKIQEKRRNSSFEMLDLAQDEELDFN
jgi:kinesin family protein 2/24